MIWIDIFLWVWPVTSQILLWKWGDAVVKINWKPTYQLTNWPPTTEGRYYLYTSTNKCDCEVRWNIISQISHKKFTKIPNFSKVSEFHKRGDTNTFQKESMETNNWIFSKPLLDSLVEQLCILERHLCSNFV